MRRAHRSAHFAIWVALALILPALLVSAFALRGVAPDEALATRLPDIALGTPPNGGGDK